MELLKPTHVIPRSAGEVAENFSLALHGDSSARFGSVCHDSRDVEPGALFFALPGALGHGARYVDEAIRRGATAVLTDLDGFRELGERSPGIPVLVGEQPRALLGPVAAWLYGTGTYGPSDTVSFAVTGTNGKTSVAYLIWSILGQLGIPALLSSTAERRIADWTAGSSLTTPEASEVHALLAAGIERGVRHQVLEVSAHALSRYRVEGFRASVAGFTNLSHDHLDEYGDFESYYRAKRALFEPARADRAVIVIDDLWGRRLANETSLPLTTLSARKAAGADWQVTVSKHSLGETQFSVSGPLGELDTRVSLFGDYAATNAALAIVMLTDAGISFEAIAEVLRRDNGINVYVPGRGELVTTGVGPSVMVDYAHTPEAFRALLAAVRKATRGRTIMVFGADGDRDPSKREAMGAVAAEGSDLVVVTDFHPRYEDPGSIRRALITGAQTAVPHREVIEIADPAAAIRYAVSRAEAEDVVVYSGPGHEEYHEVRGVKHPYSARAEARAALIEAGWVND